MLDLFQGCLYIDDYRVEKKFIRNEQKCLSSETKCPSYFLYKVN